MAINLYMDVHIPQAITDQLRRRGVDVLTAFDDEAQEFPDNRLLLRATQLNRVLFTQDIRFRVLAETWQVEGKQFSGLIFGHQLGGTIGQFVRDLELIAKASEPDEWMNTVEYIPFK
ncbi:MAG: hypothetical protein F6J86_27380 [Symploca sp. SIO1B1]|nr:hypothetical protein [Symploca sp. SIO1A3]NER97528.1 hypothetical protein [Symploca sp. SIO1B1]